LGALRLVFIIHSLIFYNSHKFGKQKILIITYWPPAGGPGVQRWLKFVKYLPDFGIQPMCMFQRILRIPLLDANLIKEVSDKAIVLKQKIFELYQLAFFFEK
jgi:hypothetical protein